MIYLTATCVKADGVVRIPTKNIRAKASQKERVFTLLNFLTITLFQITITRAEESAKEARRVRPTTRGVVIFDEEYW
jgi:hypothetical protein